MNEYTYAELQAGQIETFSTEVTLEMEEQFRRITGDVNPLHRDDQYAREISGGRFQSHVTFGMLTASLYSTLAGVYLPGKYWSKNKRPNSFCVSLRAGPLAYARLWCCREHKISLRQSKRNEEKRNDKRTGI